MRLWATISICLLIVAACGGGQGGSTSTTSREPATTTVPVVRSSPATLAEEAAARTSFDTPTVWEGFEATAPTPPVLAALARGPIDVYESPDGPAPALTIEERTILGTSTVLGVVSEPIDGWVEVMLPIRPNGSTGWVETEAVSLFVADSTIVVDLSDRRLSYLVDGVEVLSTEVGVGSVHNQTPTGHYFVTDSVTLADPNSAWGPHALGISARSETITEFNGGDGIIGIHGTNNPSSIGGDISLGCVRLPNDMITALHALVPIGTRVIVHA